MSPKFRVQTPITRKGLRTFSFKTHIARAAIMMWESEDYHKNKVGKYSTEIVVTLADLACICMTTALRD